MDDVLVTLSAPEKILKAIQRLSSYRYLGMTKKETRKYERKQKARDIRNLLDWLIKESLESRLVAVTTGKKAKKNTVWVVWGDKKWLNLPKRYDFKNSAALEAFKLGIAESRGWVRAQVITNEKQLKKETDKIAKRRAKVGAK
jgi:hypothetical protein